MMHTAPMMPPRETRNSEPASPAEVAEQIKALLPRQDLELMELHLSGQISLRPLARALNCSAGYLSRRIQGIVQRVTSPEAQLIATHGDELDLLHREVATRFFIWGQPKLQICRELGLYPNFVRNVVSTVSAWVAVRRRPHGDDST